MSPFRRRDPAPAPTPPADPLAAIDRAQVPPRLLGQVDAAVAAAHRYRALVHQRAPGPVRDRMASLGATVDAGVLAAYDAARGAGRLDAVAAALDVDAATDAYKRARRDGADPALVEAQRQRFESVQRVLNARDDVEPRLTLVIARLEAVVAQAAALAVGDGGDLGPLDAALAEVGAELGALRAGLDELT